MSNVYHFNAADTGRYSHVKARVYDDTYDLPFCDSINLTSFIVSSKLFGRVLQ